MGYRQNFNVFTSIYTAYNETQIAIILHHIDTYLKQFIVARNAAE